MTRVLIVDDAEVVRFNLKKILEKNGFEVVGEAGDGITAVNLYMQLKPDIVTMDITMPEMDGIAALKMIRANDPSSKIVMVSSLGRSELYIEAIESGATNFITKPFDENVVVKTLKCICA